MTWLSFEIEGKVKAKQSFKIGKNGFKYTPSDVKSYANWVRLCFKSKYPNWRPAEFQDRPLGLRIWANFTIPKSYSKKKREQALKGLLRPTVKPDCDNISKNICDALNGIAFPDDKQIVALQVEKLYAETDSVLVQIHD